MQRPARKFVYAVLLLRLAWLVPVTLMALAYTLYSVTHLVQLMRYPASAAAAEFLEALFGAGLGAAFLFFTWRMWKKTWNMLLNKVYPVRSAVLWQTGWIILAVILPFLVIWPKVKDIQRYSGEGANKGRLSQLRTAVAEYKAASGVYPRDLAELERSGLLKKVPALWDTKWAGFPHEPTYSAVYGSPEPGDSGGWAYALAKDSAPVIFIDCIHKDSRGVPWSAY